MIEINGARSEGAIRTMEEGKEGGEKRRAGADLLGIP